MFCNECFKMLNDAIEEESGEYVNTLIYEYDPLNENNDRWISLPIEFYTYGKRNRDVIREYEKHLPDLTQEILSGNTSTIYENLLRAVQNAPKLSYDIIVYRGMAIQLNMKPGDTFKHSTLIWSSFHKEYAMKFTNNTVACYNGSGGFDGLRPFNGTLLKIIIPKGTKCLQRYINVDFNNTDYKSELIFEPSYLDCIASNGYETHTVLRS